MSQNYEEVRKRLRYEPETGKFYSKVHNSNVKIGQEMKGVVDNKGYIRIGVGGKIYKAHRLAFICMEQNLPEQVDHKNRVKTDNRWSNLRAANQSKNQWNTKERSTSTSGYKNVYWRSQRNKWVVFVRAGEGKSVYIGTYSDVEEANIAATNARIKYQGEFCHAEL